MVDLGSQPPSSAKDEEQEPRRPWSFLSSSRRLVVLTLLGGILLLVFAGMSFWQVRHEFSLVEQQSQRQRHTVDVLRQLAIINVSQRDGYSQSLAVLQAHQADPAADLSALIALMTNKHRAAENAVDQLQALLADDNDPLVRQDLGTLQSLVGEIISGRDQMVSTYLANSNPLTYLEWRDRLQRIGAQVDITLERLRARMSPLLDAAQGAVDRELQRAFLVSCVVLGAGGVLILVLGWLLVSYIDKRDQAEQRAMEAQHALENRVQERTRQLARSVSLLHATLEASGDGILAHNYDEQTIYYNKRYQTMWSMPDHLLQAETDPGERIKWIAKQAKTPEHYQSRRSLVVSEQVTENFFIYELQDGRVIERYANAQRVGGETVGVVLSFRDITERRRAERELESIHRQLLESSRQAGMAEVATGVLHNVGNVLNSVNVSANLITEHIKNSKAASLVKVAEMLREHREQLTDFIVNDPKGKHLPAYLIQLADYVPKEQKIIVDELESLRDRIDHIKQIVSMQQTYSKVSGIKEVVNVIDLLEDSLRMNDGAFQRHGIKIVRDFSDVPLINAEKHKILQILVNLVRNAKHACSDSGQMDKCITLRATRNDTHVVLEVIDNGIGIAPENLTQIFSHGFTTRKDGHGFGLHASAIAGRELGGALRVHSAGIGHGAAFTLELPVASHAHA